jgi:hypothetical protein
MVLVEVVQVRIQKGPSCYPKWQHVVIIESLFSDFPGFVTHLWQRLVVVLRYIGDGPLN